MFCTLNSSFSTYCKEEMKCVCYVSVLFCTVSFHGKVLLLKFLSEKNLEESNGWFLLFWRIIFIIKRCSEHRFCFKLMLLYLKIAVIQIKARFFLPVSECKRELCGSALPYFLGWFFRSFALVCNHCSLFFIAAFCLLPEGVKSNQLRNWLNYKFIFDSSLKSWEL